MFGGGFVNEATPNQNQTQGEQGSAQKEQRQYRNQIIPCSIKMVVQCLNDQQNQFLNNNGVEFQLFVIVGRILSYQDEQNIVKVTLSDDTSQLECQLYKRNDQYPGFWNNIQVNTQINQQYVKAVVTYQNYKGQHKFSINNMWAITDYNELNRFTLDVILRDLQRSKGFISHDQNNKQQQNQQQGSTQGNNVNKNQTPQQQVYQQMVHFKDQGTHNIHINYLQEELKHLSLQQIRSSLNELKQNGDIFDIGTSDTYAVA